jgi:RNA polymerase sigma factor (sigma-70 family)
VSLTFSIANPSRGRPSLRWDPEENEDLLKRAIAGETAAWNEIVRRFSPLIGTVARSFNLSPSDASDITQVVWLRLFEHMERIRSASLLGAWLTTVTRRECLRALRKTDRERPAPEEHLDRAADGDAGDVERGVLASERDTIVSSALDEVSPQCQTLLRLLMEEARPSYGRVASTLDMPVGSIGPTRQRCLNCLRRHKELVALHELALAAS